MNEENFLFVRRIGNAVRDGLGPYVLNAYKFKYTKKQYLEVLQETLSKEHPFDNYGQALESLDLQAWLNAMEFKWQEVFKRKLGHTTRAADRDTNVSRARSYVNELRRTRNLFSHEAPKDEFTEEDVYRIADTATRLLKAVKAKEEAAKTEAIKQEFGRKIYEVTAEAREPEPVQEQAAPAETEDQVSEEQPLEASVEDDSQETEFRVDLRGLNLSGQDLRGRHLHLAKLQGADLSGSNWQYSHLADMDLSNAKLSKSNFTGANLRGSNMRNADLSQAQLGYANLTNANLSHAKMPNADLRNAELNAAVFSRADLTGVDMSNPKLYYMNRQGYEIEAMLFWDLDGELFDHLSKIAPGNVNLSYTILRGANMQRMFFSDSVDLTRADMTDANFFGARIERGSFDGAILNSTNLSKCHILQCDFSNAKMQGVDLSESECIYTNFSNADMSSANLENFCAGDIELEEGQSWNNVDLSKANLRGAILGNIPIRNANLTGAIFQGANLSGADFSNADLNETDFTDADLTGADFTGAKFSPLSTILPDGSYWDEDTDMTRFTG